MIKKTGENCAVVTTLQCVRPHGNADKIKLATVLGTQVVVGLDAKDGDVVVYFDSNLKLSDEFLKNNNLYSDATLNVDTTKKGYFGKNGRVRAQNFRGELSNGFVAGPELFTFADANIYLEAGTEFNSINGHEICDKYVVPTNHVQGTPKKQDKVVSDMFIKHWDTKQLMRELNSINQSTAFYLEEKIHGTSGRTGRVLCYTGKKWYQFWKPDKEWKVISGTRRVDNINCHIPQIRKEIENKVAPHLKKGETLYYEIYGYDGGKEIQTGFPYDCRPGEYKAMLYRVTMTNEDGQSFDLSRKQVYARADELGLIKPHLFESFVPSDQLKLQEAVVPRCKGKSFLDASTLLEGVVVWFEDTKGNWTCLKHKSPEFLLLDDRNKEKGIGDAEDSI